jgi:tetratricopeptide (TPR) repeat protein
MVKMFPMLQFCHRALLALTLLLAFHLPARANDADLCLDAAVDPDAAIPACTRLLEAGKLTEAQAADAYGQRGIAKAGKGDLDGALKDLTAALDRNPKMIVALALRGKAYKELKNFDLAIADFSRALRDESLRAEQNQPLAAELYNLRGLTLVDRDEYDAAVADFNRAISIDRKSGAAYINRGQAFYFKREFDKAIADFEQAVRLDPKDPFGYSNRAMARMEKADFKGAIADYDNAIRLDPQNPTWRTRRGEAWRLQGDLERSLADHDHALSLKPSEEVFNNRALTLKDMGRLAEARGDCSEAILINPSYDLAYTNRGLIRRLAGDLRGSLQDLDKAVGLAQRSPLALTFRGDAYREIGDIERALQDYDEAIRILPDFIAAHAGRGLALEKKGDRPGAKAAYQKAASLPSDAGAGVAKPAQKLAKDRLAAIKAQDIAEGLDFDPGVRVALVIGNSAYRAVPALPNPERDADAVAKAFERLGFKTVIKLNNATNASFLAALKSFEEQAAKADWGVIFYAGHGFQLAGGNYLIPVDAQLRADQDVQKEAVPLERVLQAANKAKKLRLVLLDACRDNPFEPKMKRVITAHVVTRGLSSIEPRGGTLVAYATRDGHTAEDGDGDHSPFTQALLDNIMTRGLEINMLFRQVRDRVLKLTEGRQDPFTYGSLSSERFFFVGK